MRTSTTLELDWGYRELPKVARLVSSAPDIPAACQIVARHLRHFDFKLISINFCDLLDEHAAIRPYRDMPKALASLSKQFIELGGCPIIREARRLRSPFDALAIDRNRFPEFLDQRFLEELAKLGHRQIMVFPIAIGRGLANLVVGTGDVSLTATTELQLYNSLGQTFSAIRARFPEIAGLFETKILSELQAEILFLLSIGTSLKEVGQILQLSEPTLTIMLQSAQVRLGAKSIPHAIAKALASGEFSNMNLSAAELL